MSNASLVTLALEILQCNQTELAEKLKVSKVQVSKWKNGESMSWEMQQKLTKILKIDDLDPEFILRTGSLQDAKKWKKLMIFLGEMADEGSDNTIRCERLRDDFGSLISDVFDLLISIGVEIPKSFPVDLDIKGGYLDWVCDEEADEDREALLYGNPYCAFIRELFGKLTDVNAFFSKYMFHHIYGDLDGVGNEMDYRLLDLAATNMSPDVKFAPKFSVFKRRTIADYEEWIGDFKVAMFNAGKPLEVEYMDLVKESSDSLSVAVERDELGFDHRIHPDIYMNELLTTTRRIDAILPLILKKLDIDPEEIRKALYD